MVTLQPFTKKNQIYCILNIISQDNEIFYKNVYFYFYFPSRSYSGF